MRFQPSTLQSMYLKETNSKTSTNNLIQTRTIMKTKTYEIFRNDNYDEWEKYALESGEYEPCGICLPPNEP